MSIIHNNSIVGASGNQNQTYTIARSLRFRSSASGNLSKSYSGGAGSTTTFTWAGWVKRGAIGSVTHHLFNGGSGVNTFIGFGQINYDDLSGNLRGTGGTNYFFATAAVFRDPAAYYHIIFAVDTTQATASNRMKLYVNGVLQTLSTANYPPQNQAMLDTGTRFMGQSGSTYYLDGYMTDVHFIDGQALTPASFGESDAITGVWKPKRYAGTYGTNGFKLDFSDNSAATAAAIGKDSSGNGNNWTPNNISVTAGATYDSMTDVPTLTSATAANYCVLNPLDKGTNCTVSDGNLKMVESGASQDCMRATIAVPSSGQWYWEVNIAAIGSGGNIGVATQSSSLNAGGSLTGVLSQYTGYYSINSWGNNGSYTSWTTNDVLAVAVDTTAGSVTFYKNGTSLGAIASSLSSANQYFPFFQGTGTTYNVNFGQRPFAYTPPSGFKALNTFNLPDSAIPAGNKVMDATTYTGNNSTLSVVNAGGFKPDLVWGKIRGNTYDHQLFDSVRGVTKSLSTNTTGAEATVSGVTAFNSNGFTLGSNANINNSAANVAWQWQAGQGTTSTNTSGSRTSTVSANASAGFSVVTYTGNNTAGATIGHGLGVKPSMIIIKNRNSGTTDWLVYHTSLGATKYLLLQSTNATGTSNLAFNNTEPTSSVFTVGGWDVPNGNGNSHVAYCWSEVAGFSKFGSYTGNGSTDGTFVYTGFRPKWIMYKRTDTGATNWIIIDTSRDQYNLSKQFIFPNQSNAEGSDSILDALSNGFKFRANWTDTNASGGTYIYACFAESPFKNSLAR